MGSSVKEQVIALARKDPFLTVEELANHVGTTTPYVRTILSEADLSLNQMRKEYARQLELRLGQHVVEREFVIHPQLQVTKVTLEQLGIESRGWEGRDLFQVGEVQNTAPLRSYLQLVTPLPLTIRADYRSLRDLLPFPTTELVVEEQRVEVVQAPTVLGEALQWSTNAQSLRLSTYLHMEGELVALELHWLALEGLVLEFLPQNGELKVSLTG